MVNMTLSCIPDHLKHPGAIGSILDYGCAEGAITSQLRKQLNINVNQAYGADVRNLQPDGFTFVQLPAEGDQPSHIGTILPSLGIYLSINLSIYLWIMTS
jgi:hypothetical protein